MKQQLAAVRMLFDWMVTGQVVSMNPAAAVRGPKHVVKTGNEKGIRHALLDQPVAQVDETDALYILGSCASFVSYLINKARQAGLL